MSHLTHTEFRGLEYIPKSGPVLITTNHLSRMDIPILFVQKAREDITALVADKYQNNLFFRWFSQTSCGIWIDRNRADFSAFQAAYQVLKNGGALGISPEGTRSQTGSLLEGKPGAVFIATKSDVPIVPVGITGSETAFDQLQHLKKPRMVAQFGPAYHLPPLDRNRRTEHIKELTDEIMCRIAACLPGKYQGVYANYPRVKQLQTEQALIQE